MPIQEIIEHVFGNEFLQDLKCNVQSKNPEETIGEDWNYTLEDVKFTVNKVLNKINPNQLVQDGRIGPTEIIWDTDVKTRHLSFSVDKLTATCTSPKGYGTAKANSALCKGKWQYEVQLGTCGIMQVGWCTIQCKFMGDTGVGDTTHSYAYDGQRKKKWNVSAHNYGETWFAGDIIGTAIDLDEGTIEFYRNGFSMGIAFEKIQTGPGMAYFPAISLSNGEVVVANFGGSPFKYPLPGYEPIQLPPLKDTIKANILLDWVRNLLTLQDMKPEISSNTNCKVSSKALLYLFASLLYQILCTLLNKTYVIEASLLPFIKRLIFAQDKQRKPSCLKAEYPNVNLFLDYAWMFLENHEIGQVLNVIVESLDSTYRRITYNVDYPHQKETLCVVHALVKHTATRRFLISHVFFHNIMIHNFLHIKPLDDKILTKLVPVVSWEHERDGEVESEEEEVRRKYLDSIRTMYDSITEVEQMHLAVLRVLFTNTDGTVTASQGSSRKLFLKEFQDFLKKHYLSRFRHHSKTPKILGPTLCSNFYQLISLLQVLWKEELAPAPPVLVPIHKFCRDGYKTMDHACLGGSVLMHPELFDQNTSANIPLTLLMSTVDISQVIREANLAVLGDIPTENRPLPVTHGQQHPVTSNNLLTNSTAISNQQQVNPVISNQQQIISISPNQQQRSSQNQNLRQLTNQEAVRSKPVGEVDMLLTPGNADNEESLVELLNSIVLMYHCGVHQQLIKVATIKSKMRDYARCYMEYKQLHKRCAESGAENLLSVELDKYFEVCRENIDMQGRHVAWILSAIFSPSKQQQLAWLLRVLLRTLQRASETGPRFKCMPCFYVDSMLMITSVLRTHFEPLAPLSKVPGSFDILKSVAEFLTSHIPDDRISDKSIKDSLRESAAGFFCSPLTLKCMESVSDQSRESFVRTLLKAYQGTNWAQTNWILVRIWHGSGFAFRYTQFPHLSKFGPDLVQNDMSTNFICMKNTPCPSSVYQKEIQRLLLEDADVASSFLNSLLNQLNWAFSEFIGMMQTIQNEASQHTTISIESHHIVITATCFEILVCLLRVLEMVMVQARPLFTDPAFPNAANMLERLAQFLCQLLLRCSSNTGCFNYLLNLDIKSPEIISVDHFPILSAVAGVLIALLADETRLNPDAEEYISIPPVTRVLLAENFPLQCMKFMLNEGDESENANASSNKRKAFTFENYKDDISEEEIGAIRRVIASFQLYQKRLSIASELLDDDNKCAICYNYDNSAKFEPCGHESCKSCINHHLLNTRLCFFCKSQIMRVLELNSGTVLHDLHEPPPQA